MHWIDLAEDEDNWPAVVNAVRNRRVTSNAGDVLTSWDTVSFIRMTLLLAVTQSVRVRLIWISFFKIEFPTTFSLHRASCKTVCFVSVPPVMTQFSVSFLTSPSVQSNAGSVRDITTASWIISNALEHSSSRQANGRSSTRETPCLWGPQMLSAVFARRHYWTQPWARLIQFTPSSSIFRPILVLFCHLRLGYGSNVFASCVPTKILY
jgi:hypothetical protein